MTFFCRHKPAHEQIPLSAGAVVSGSQIYEEIRESEAEATVQRGAAASVIGGTTSPEYEDVVPTGKTEAYQIKQCPAYAIKADN